jgi:ubiquinone/menaquinone biosynthesis C-methylase UbiE
MWDANAETWAHDVRKGYDTYRDLFSLPAFVKFVGDLRGLTVLDLGCGEGSNTRLLARQGARMTGADISQEMIHLAREAEEEEPLGIRYEAAPGADMPVFGDASFDAVVSMMAMMDCADYEGAVGEVARVLKADGWFAFSVPHPCFAHPTFGHEHAPDGRIVHLNVGDYFDGTPDVQVWRFARAPKGAPGQPFQTPRFPRTLSQYLNALPCRGLMVEEVQEPRPTEEACRADRRLQQWLRMPLLLYVRARRA